MAKKKKRKDHDKKKFEYSNELIGLLLILLSIIGIGNYGPAGNFVKSFAVFFVGILYILLLLFLLYIGGYLIIKREMPNLLTSRLIGFYIIITAALIFFHLEYGELNDFKLIISETYDNVLLSFNSSSSLSLSENISILSNCGGGMVGALFMGLCNMAFKEGTLIVVITLFIVGLVLMLNTSIASMLSKLNIFSKIKFKKDKKEEVVESDEEVKEEKEDDKKIIISSMSELTQIKDKEVGEKGDNDIPIATENSNKVKEEKDSKNIYNANYKLPPLSLLKNPKAGNNKDNEAYAKSCIDKIEQTLQVFEIVGHVVQVNIGPTVTQYELEIKTGTKVNKLLSIQRELALALAAKEVRIQAPIPGKNTIGLELPNKTSLPVSFKEILSCMPEVNPKTLLAVGLGKNIMGAVKWAEINTTPHMLIAGATGSGKSVCINCLIASILMRTRPDEVKLVMVDPKKVELSMYNGIPHLLAPVVTDPKKASIALKNIVNEMEKRYDIFERTKCKNIIAYNEMCKKNPDYQRLPYIVVIIDELADLMLVAAKEVEDSILRITQMARAAGIHLIVATQRPSTDVITGVVKANIPSRISFAVSSNIDSRTILDCVGAEKLLGKGDMLFLPMGENIPMRVQGAYVSEEELQKIVDWTISQQKACYDESLTEDRTNTNVAGAYDDAYQSEENYDDPLYNEIVDFAVKTGKISASLVQRKYRLGYNRAARIIDLLEERGIIGPQNGSKPREVLVKLEINNEEGEE